MEKESYSIDDILSEVKKRREENEFSIKHRDNKSVEKTEEKEVEFSLNASEQTSVDSEKEEEFSLKTNDDDAVFEKAEKDDLNDVEFTVESDALPMAEKEPEFTVENADAPRAENEPVFSQSVKNESSADDEQPTEEVTEQENVVSDNQPEQEVDPDGMVDLLSLAAEDYSEEELSDNVADDKKYSKSKKGKTAKIVIIILVLLIVAAGVFAFLYANNMLNKVTNNSEEEPYEMVTYYDGMDFLQEDFPTIDELSASELYSYKEYLKQWYLNGDPVSSTHILNVLLIGEDTRNEEISDTSRADSAIIASVNIDTGEVTLTSILRDMYVYFEVDGEGQYGKINAAASLGGMKTYINTIERYYKIAINNYAVVNFASFPKIIDALNGVSIKITSAEISEINNHPKRYGGVTITQSFDGAEGTMKLNGKQALAYCRIRKIDSDGARANRQKTVLNALFKKMKSSGTVDIVKTVNELAGYVYTGYSKKELIEIGNTALKDGWLNYKVKTANIPGDGNCKGGQNFSAAPGNWIWLADIPKDAYELQMSVYGKSNINLNENRADYIAMGR